MNPASALTGYGGQAVNPLTVAGPCGLCTHFPCSLGGVSCEAEYSTLEFVKDFT